MLLKATNEKKRLSIPARASLAYTVASIISKSISIITVPIYTRLLSTYEVGEGTVYTSWYSILYSIITLSITSGSLNIGMMEYKKDRNKYESSCLSICTITGVLFLLSCIVCAPIVRSITNMTSAMILMLGVGFIFNPALDMWYARQRYEYKYISSVVVSISMTLMSAILSISAIYFFKETRYDLGEVRIVSQGIVQLAFAIVLYVYIYVKGKVIYERTIWKNALIWSCPLIVHSVSKNILDLSDRLMIDKICGKSEAGIYGIVYSIAMLSLVLWNAINISLIPVVFEKLKLDDNDSLNIIILPLLIVFGIVSVLVTLFAPEILYIIAPDEYKEAVYLVPALSAGVYFTALYNIYGNFLLFRKKTIKIMNGTIIAAVTNVILNLVFINLIGYIAAAYTTFFSYVVLAIVQGVLSKNEFGYSIVDTKKTVIISMIVGVACIMCIIVFDKPRVRYVIVGILLTLALLMKNRIWKSIKPLVKSN